MLKKRVVLAVLISSIIVLFSVFKKNEEQESEYKLPTVEEAGATIQTKDFYWDVVEKLAAEENLDLKYKNMVFKQVSEKNSVVTPSDQTMCCEVRYLAKKEGYSVFVALVLWSKNNPNEIYLLNSIQDQEYSFDYQPTKENVSKILTKNLCLPFMEPLDPEAKIIAKEIPYATD